jgi:dihydropteroate synthase
MPAHGIWRLRTRVIDLQRRPCVMGILNVTPDSFSDGSRFTDIDAAVGKALEMEASGADIIDVGGESTRPSAAAVDEEEELRRVIPVIQALTRRLTIPLSIDTYKARVAREAVQAGAEIVNDVGALAFDAAMADTVAGSGAGLVLMHTRGRPADMQRDTRYDDLIGEIVGSLGRSLDRARAAGISMDRLVVDPGIGFGKDLQANLRILNRLDEFAVLGYPLLVGTSRKSFIGTVLGREVDGRLFGTAATVCLALAKGAAVFRVHDVREMRDVLDMAAAVLHA